MKWRSGSDQCLEDIVKTLEFYRGGDASSDRTLQFQLQDSEETVEDKCGSKELSLS